MSESEKSIEYFMISIFNPINSACKNCDRWVHAQEQTDVKRDCFGDYLNSFYYFFDCPMYCNIEEDIAEGDRLAELSDLTNYYLQYFKEREKKKV